MDEMQMRELLESMDNTAHMLRQFFLRLVNEGFTEAQALALTRTWLHSIFGGTET